MNVYSRYISLVHNVKQIIDVNPVVILLNTFLFIPPLRLT